MRKYSSAAALAAIALLLTACNTKPALHFGPYVSDVNQSSAKVMWVTPPGAADSQVVVDQGATVKIHRQKVLDHKETLHTATVTGLQPGNTYQYMLQFTPPGKIVGSRTGQFRTAPADDSTEPIRFLVYGDTRTYPKRHRLVANAMKDSGPADFLVLSGDLVGDGTNWPSWKKQFFDPGDPVLRHTTIWPALGNHEMDGRLCKQLFDLPRSYYSFDFGNVHVAVIDSENTPRKADPEMLAWLENDLMSSKAKWKIVSYHRPTFDIVSHRATWGQKDLLPVLERGGVDMVMNGHTHNYQRFRPIASENSKPIIFCVAAGGGAPNYPVNPSPIIEKYYSGLHYCIFNVNGSTLEMTAKYPDGRVLDYIKLVKNEQGTYQKEILDRTVTATFAREAAFLVSGFFAHSPKSPEPGQPVPLLISPLDFPEGAVVEIASAAQPLLTPGEIQPGHWTIPPAKLSGFKNRLGLTEEFPDATYEPMIVMAYAPPDLRYTAKSQPVPGPRVSIRVTYQGETYVNHSAPIVFRSTTIKSWQAQRDALSLGAAASTPLTPPTMRILHYNILDGCENQPERLERLHAWIAGQDADVAGLDECNTWNQPPGMAPHANACGFPHSHLLAGHSRYLIALMSRSPIELLDQITTGVHHGILHARTAGIHFICSHFSPHERLMRVHEARTVAAFVTKISEPLVVMGDFNSASPADIAAAELIPPDRREWATDFEPQQILRSTGLIDLATRDENHRGTLNPHYHPAGAHRWMDYIYINEAFKTLYPRTTVTPIRDEETRTLSDHFPLLLDTH